MVRAASVAVHLIEALVRHHLYSVYKDDVTAYGVACHFHTYKHFLLAPSTHLARLQAGMAQFVPFNNPPSGVKIISFK